MPAFMLPKFCVYEAGEPLEGGKVYVFEAGTVTPVTTYSDSALTTPNTTPVVLDSEGRADIWVASGDYKVTVDDADDVNVFTVDEITLHDVPDDPMTRGELVAAKPLNSGISSQGSDTYVISVNLGNNSSAYATGQTFWVDVDTANSGAATLNVTNSYNSASLGAKSILTMEGNALKSNDIPSGSIILVVYDGTYFRLIGCYSRRPQVAIFTTAGSGASMPSGWSVANVSTGVCDITHTLATQSLIMVATSNTAGDFTVTAVSTDANTIRITATDGGTPASATVSLMVSTYN